MGEHETRDCSILLFIISTWTCVGPYLSMGMNFATEIILES